VARDVGEVELVVRINGAGRATLLIVMSGVYHPDRVRSCLTKDITKKAFLKVLSGLKRWKSQGVGI
jgi:ABC-type branched-subunit amino acid transport system ATPase component